MRILFDTHVVLWQSAGERALGPHARRRVATAAELLFSVVSFAEIGVKASVGKLTVPDDFDARLLQSGVRILGLSPAHGLAVRDLPPHHRDPFDRLLVAQARHEQLALMSADNRLRAYDVVVLDPRT